VDFGDPTQLAGEGTALTIAASAAFCGAILGLIAAGAAKQWGARLGFLGLMTTSAGMAVGFWRVSEDVTGAFIVFGGAGSFAVLLLVAAWDRLSGNREASSPERE
jgi:hypothetical protein